MLDIRNLYSYVLGIREYVDKILITTSLPISILQNSNYFIKLMGLIDGLNVSIQHYDPELNNNLLCASMRFNRIELLKDILAEEDWVTKIRVSINLCKGFIDNRAELEKCISVMETIHCRHVKINELQNVSKELYVSFEEVMNIKMHSPFSLGCQSDVSYLFETNMKIEIKRSCFFVQEDEVSNFHYRDLLKVIHQTIKKRSTETLVLYENGLLNNGWMRKEIEDEKYNHEIKQEN